jgi:hypothetical protein
VSVYISLPFHSGVLSVHVFFSSVELQTHSLPYECLSALQSIYFAFWHSISECSLISEAFLYS